MILDGISTTDWSVSKGLERPHLSCLAYIAWEMCKSVVFIILTVSKYVLWVFYRTSFLPSSGAISLIIIGHRCVTPGKMGHFIASFQNERGELHWLGQRLGSVTPMSHWLWVRLSQRSQTMERNCAGPQWTRGHPCPYCSLMRLLRRPSMKKPKFSALPNFTFCLSCSFPLWNVAS